MSQFIYFVKPVGMQGPIKIGVSWKPIDRLENLMLWSPFPLEIVLSFDGDCALEKNIHDCFADCHSHKEWFHPSERLITAIDRIKSGEDVRDVINLDDKRGNVRWLTMKASRIRNGTDDAARGRKSSKSFEEVAS